MKIYGMLGILQTLIIILRLLSHPDFCLKQLEGSQPPSTPAIIIW